MNIRVATRQKVKKSLTFHWPLNSFHWPFINEKHVYIHFSLFCRPSIVFSSFSTSSFFSRKEERKHSQRKPLTTTTTCVKRGVSNWSFCLLCSILFVFSGRKCISKSWRKLINYKPENTILPDFSLTLTISKIFPDFSQNAYNYGAHMPYIIRLPCFRVPLIIIT